MKRGDNIDNRFPYLINTHFNAYEQSLACKCACKWAYTTHHKIWGAIWTIKGSLQYWEITSKDLKNLRTLEGIQLIK